MAKWNELIKGRQNITGTTECIISNTSKTQDEIQNQQQPMAEWDLVIEFLLWGMLKGKFLDKMEFQK